MSDPLADPASVRVAAGDPRDRDRPLLLGGVEVARYVYRPELEPYVSPRPYLHPVRTLRGTPVTDAAPVDHRWHLGVSVAIADVTRSGDPRSGDPRSGDPRSGDPRSGDPDGEESTNFWGGRSYRLADGYQPRGDHGTIRQVSCVWQEDGFGAELEWIGRGGGPVLRETRTVRATAVGVDAWRLDLSFTLHNVHTDVVRLGSPGTHGRAEAGYGGFFWRAPASAAAVEAWSPAGRGEEAVHGRPAPWLALTADAGAPSTGYTLVFLPGDAATAADPWFVRIAAYPGVGSALAYRQPVQLAAGGGLTRAVRVLVADGRRSPAAVDTLLASMADR